MQLKARFTLDGTNGNNETAEVEVQEIIYTMGSLLGTITNPDDGTVLTHPDTGEEITYTIGD